MRRNRFTRGNIRAEDTDRERVRGGEASRPVTPRAPAALTVRPDSTMMYNYGPTNRRRINVDLRDLRFMEAEEKARILPAARTIRVETPKPSDEDMKEIIQVKSLNFHIAENCKPHHTDKYDQSENRTTEEGKEEKAELIVRRGQEFRTTLTFDRPYDPFTDNIQLVFKIGSTPRPQWQTLVTVPVKVEDESRQPDIEPAKSSQWRVSVVSQEGNSLTVTVYIAADCIIGEWDIAIYSIKHKPDERPQVFVYDHPENIFILLNPWSPDDLVYMPSRDLLNEYVLNDSGGIFVGNYKNIRPRPWFYGQFEDQILDITLHLLRKAFGYEISTKMADPVLIGRALSKMVNSNDDRGVLTGRWDGEYQDGKSPSSWTGSVAILDQYEKNASVIKYGQCWVFSGVLTTVCRTIGLPCRSVSNFKSAHDTDGNTTVDRHVKFDENNEVVFINERSKDSIWNFHVWNDAWMARPDLPTGHGGWQSIDSTPQELSEGSFQCGPSPLAAAKTGNIYLPYDTPFVFAEVNGHVVYWEMKSETEWKQIHVDKFEVGKYISTKVPNGQPLRNLAWGGDNPDREDITLDYKHPDGSEEEEKAMSEVTRQLEMGLTYKQPKKDIGVWMKPISAVEAGQGMDLIGVIYNNSEVDLTVSVGLSATISTYNGIGLKDIGTKVYRKEKIEAGRKLLVELNLGPDAYLGNLISNGAITVRIQGKVLETGEAFIKMDNFIVKPPELDVDILKKEEDLEVRKPFRLKLSFTNPLNVPLTGCKLELSGQGMMGRVITIKPRQETVQPGEEFLEVLALLSRKAGIKELVVTLDTNELPDIYGYKTVFIFFAP